MAAHSSMEVLLSNGQFAPGLAHLLDEQARQRAQSEAIVYQGRRITYGQLNKRSQAIAHQLRMLGVQAGDRVGLLFPNHPDYVAAFFAITGLGSTVVLINPLLKGEEIAHILTDSRARYLVCHGQSTNELIHVLPTLTFLDHIIVARDGSPGWEPNFGSIKFNWLTDLLTAPDKVAWPQALEPATCLAVLVYTSGTTGKPKGAMLTHSNLLFSVQLAQNAFSLRTDDRFLGILPLCHIYGLTVVMLGAISVGASLVVLEKFNAAGAVAALEEERITVLPAVPAMYQFMLMDLENKSRHLSCLRACISGAASLPTEIFAKIEHLFGAPLLEGYGLTEVSCLATFNGLSSTRKVGSVGNPFPGVDVAIVGEDGQHLPPGKSNVGEIAVKGPNVMSGYYGQPEATRQAIRCGWFFTGDLAYRDEEDFIYIVGRKKELIIRGGQNVYPAEVEDVISRLDSVVEVAVVGVPDQFMGERVKAFVVKRNGSQLTEDDVKGFCGQHLAEYKVPRLVAFIEALPRNSTGKVLKRLLA